MQIPSRSPLAFWKQRTAWAGVLAPTAVHTAFPRPLQRVHHARGVARHHTCVMAVTPAGTAGRQARTRCRDGVRPWATVVRGSTACPPRISSLELHLLGARVSVAWAGLSPHGCLRAIPASCRPRRIVAHMQNEPFRSVAPAPRQLRNSYGRAEVIFRGPRQGDAQLDGRAVPILSRPHIRG